MESIIVILLILITSFYVGKKLGVIIGIVYFIGFLIVGIFSNEMFYAKISIYNIIFFGVWLFYDINENENLSLIKNIKFIAIIGFSIALFLSYTGFCFGKMRYVQNQEFINRTVDRVVDGIVREHIHGNIDMNMQSISKEDGRQYFNKIKNFITKYPNCGYVDRDSLYTGDGSIYTYVVYFYSPQEIEKINQSLHNSRQKSIVGYSYYAYYSPCGHFNGGEGGEILQGDEEDVKYNPYRKNK